jgi:ABC-type bacteriocin/lantibiotic exporter with double-glycine peptidase domain
MGSNDSIANFLAGELAEKVISVVTLVFYFAVMLTYSVGLALLSLGLGLVNIVYFMYSANKLEELNRKQSTDANKLYGTAVSGIALIETLKATGGEQGFFAKWAGYHAKQLNSQQSMGSISQILATLPNFISGLANVLVLCFGGIEIMNGNMTVGSLIAFQGLLGGFISPLGSITRLGLRIKQLKSDMNKLDDVAKYEVDEYNDPERDLPYEDVDAESFGKLSGAVEVRDLSFGYNLLEAPLIEKFSLTLKPGARVALVGGSGSGKSTVAKLIAGINQPWSGEILFDGTNRNELPRHLISNSLSVVDQDISMFSGTITDNLTMWDTTIPSENVLTAAKDANIHGDINVRKLGYNDVVSESGANFSGGQRQRLEITRALAINPSILILDEATSALDTLTEQAVMDNIRRRGNTCIIVAHRLSTIRDCDEIIVLRRGKIVQRGTHEQMLNEDGPYAELIKTAV